MGHCDRCGAPIQRGLRVCPSCGHTLRQPRSLLGAGYCRSCQKRVSPGLRVCPYCGAPLRPTWLPLASFLLKLSLAVAAIYLLVYAVPWLELSQQITGRVQIPEISFLATATFTPRPTASRTATPAPTRTATPQPSATAIPMEPTAVPSPTTQPTATKPPAPTGTPTPRFATPGLTSPDNGAEFRGSGSTIVLSWELAGALADDEWYALSLRCTADGVVRFSGTWTKDSRWTVPPDLYMMAGQNERTFSWDVTIYQQTGTRPDGGRDGRPVSATREVRTFRWY